MDWITFTNYEIQKDQMPPVCVHCGGASVGRHNESYQWHPEWIDSLYWLGFFPGLIAESFNTKEKRVSLPVCVDHDPQNKKSSDLGGVWRFFQNFLLWLTFVGAGVLIAYLYNLPPQPANREDLVEKLEQLGKQKIALTTDLAKAGFVDANPDNLVEKVTQSKLNGKNQEPKDKEKTLNDDLLVKALQLKETTREIGVLEKVLGNQANPEDNDSPPRKEWYKSPLMIGGLIGAGLGFLMLLPAAYSGKSASINSPRPKKAKPITVKEITDDSITLVGLDDAFVKAMLEQRQKKV